MSTPSSMISKLSSARSAVRNLENVMLVAGTFDVLHDGHFALFHTAFLYSKKVEIWVSALQTNISYLSLLTSFSYDFRLLMTR